MTAPTPEATMQRVADEMEEDWTRSDFSNFNTKWDMDGMKFNNYMKNM